METYNIPCNIQRYLLELLNRKTISSEALRDKMFLNYLSMQKIDEDYIIHK